MVTKRGILEAYFFFFFLSGFLALAAKKVLSKMGIYRVHYEPEPSLSVTIKLQTFQSLQLL
jgi:hypothetical protein